MLAGFLQRKTADHQGNIKLRLQVAHMIALTSSLEK
jgi:hypothetical protein